MSGDQILNKPLQILEKPENQKETKPNNFMVTINGLEVQSNLNPNALEFFPSYLQNNPTIKLNEELRRFVLKEAVDEKQNQEHTLNDRANKESKNNLEIDTEQVYILFASSSEVIHTSSEVEVLLTPDEYKNSVNDNNKQKDEILDLCNNVVDIIICEFLKNRKETEIEDDLFIQKHLLENINENHVSDTKDKNDHYQHNNKSFSENADDKSKRELVYLKPKQRLDNVDNVDLTTQTDKKVQNRNEIKKGDDKTFHSSKDKQKVHTNIKISKEFKINKGQSNINTKIITSLPPKTGAVKKPNLSKKCENQIKDTRKISTIIEPKKDIRPKVTISIVQNSNSAKGSLKTAIASKNHILSTNKQEVKPFRKEVSNIFKKDAVSSRPNGSTDKNSSSTRSSTQSSKISSTEKPLVLRSKTKECTLKSPRATVSSKLRKTETQKRRNLFYDIDNIKMSDFLFK